MMVIDEDEALRTRLENDHFRFLEMENVKQEAYMESARKILPVSLQADNKAVLFTAIQLMLNDEYLQAAKGVRL